MEKYVYFFGGGKADGNESMKNLLGGKGANLAEMAGHKDLKLPVPPGFTLTTEVCTYYYQHNKNYPKTLKKEVIDALEKVEKLMKKKFDDPNNPLLLSVRSGARKSMPGMMETVLNIGLTEKTIPGLIKKSDGNERFVYDSYRRLIMMYSDVVMEKAGGIEPENENEGIRRQLEKIMADMKKEKGYTEDSDLTAEDMKQLCVLFKKQVKKSLGTEFPDDSHDQLWGGIGAVFSSWNGKRAISYRRIEGIPDEWGTAVNVQVMVFGNMGDTSATGVAFTRNPGTGEHHFYGEYLINAQGEDVVAGIRTPAPINKGSSSDHNKDLLRLDQLMPDIYQELDDMQKRLELHYHDMQDIEFTIENHKLFMLQCRVGKRNGPSAVKMALDMRKEKLIDTNTAILRVTPEQLDELLHPIIDPKEERKKTPFAKGLPAGPGGATGQIVFSAKDAVEAQKKGKEVILVREETNPEDVEGMRASKAILTARGGMTSHAALVARGWGKCCIVGCAALHIDYAKKELHVDSKVYREGDWITLNGSKGLVYEGKLPMTDASENPLLHEFLNLCDKVKKLGVRTNADTPEDAKVAKEYGAKGIGLFRTEHMFYGKNSEEPLFRLRKMILSDTVEQRKEALQELFPYMKKDIKATLKEMDGYPVVVRLLDPPLHEFIPREKDKIDQLINVLGITKQEFEARAKNLHETNPMMGHRGVRLGITYPEVSETQIRAVLEAAAELQKEGKKPYPEIMVPVVCDQNELKSQKELVTRIYNEVLKKYGLKKIKYLFGTMIEIPRAALVADELSVISEFFSFGTNDMTQMGFGFSRDDVGGFMEEYVESKILPADPFQTIDQKGVGELIQIGITRGRSTNPSLEIGICGEHGGEAESVKFCHRVGMDYVSCSPFRVPVARLAAAQAVVEETMTSSAKKVTTSADKRKKK